MSNEYQLPYTGEQIRVMLEKTNSSVLFTGQNLEDSQKEKARENIGAADANEVMPLPQSASPEQYLRVKSVDNTGKIIEIEAVDINIENGDDNDNENANAVLYTEQTLTEQERAQARENIGAADIADQPVSQSILSEHLTWDGQSELGYSQISTNFYNYNQMQNIEITLQNADNYKIILEYCRNAEELSASIDKNLAEGESGLFFIKGSFFFLSTTSLVGLYVPNKNLELAFPLIIITDSITEFNGSQLNIGTYFYNNENNVFISDLKFNYKILVYNENFDGIFKNVSASNVYAINIEEFTNSVASQTTEEDGSSGSNSDLAQLLVSELGKYKQGDILLIPSNLLDILGGL